MAKIKMQADTMSEIPINRKLCIACGACTAVCPTEALIIVGISLEFFDSKCISCGLAQHICPVGALLCPKVGDNPGRFSRVIND